MEESDSKQDEQKYETNNFVRGKYIAKLHERVQTKYSEMQRKLEKSKSANVMSNIQDDGVLLNNIQPDNNNTVDTNNINSKQEIKFVENTRERNAKACEIEYNESITAGKTIVPIVNLIINDESEKQKSESDFLFDISFKGSLESLTEVRDSEDSLEATTPPARSIRNRIGTRIREARRNRQKEKEKQSNTKRKFSYDYVEKFILSNTTKEDTITKVVKKAKVATVTIALIQVTGFEVVHEDKTRYINCRFRLGAEKHKSKTVKSQESSVTFQELYSFNLYDDDYILETVLWDKNIQVGRSTLNLLNMEKEKTHRIQITLEESENIQIFILLTISGISNINTLFSIDETEARLEAENMRRKYMWYRFLNEVSNVGWLSVTVYGAKGLNGNDCYCILTLDNERVFTATDYKTNAPSWMKVFNFEVTDITSILEITVYDERKGEEVGNISIPLLNIQSGKKWYALKDSTQRGRAKGNNPRVLLEMKVTWNLIKASVRVINPKEVIFLQTEDKLDRHLLARNISRGRIVIMWVVNAFRIIKTCFEWDSRKSNIISLMFWLLFCYIFKLWMLPLLLLVPFVIYHPSLFGKKEIPTETGAQKEKEERSLRQKIHDYQETIQTIQNFVGKVASIGESIKNFLAIFLISIIAFVMYLIPLQYILMVWGIHKFTRKILKPNRILHNEVLDLLSRVPDDITLLNCQELPLETTDDEEY